MVFWIHNGFMDSQTVRDPASHIYVPGFKAPHPPPRWGPPDTIPNHDRLIRITTGSSKSRPDSSRIGSNYDRLLHITTGAVQTATGAITKCDSVANFISADGTAPFLAISGLRRACKYPAQGRLVRLEDNSSSMILKPAVWPCRANTWSA